MTVPTAPARRRVLLVVAGALAVLGLVLGGAGLLGATPPAPAAAEAAAPLPTTPPTAAAGPRQQPATGSPPASITIPAIDVSSPVDSVGLKPDGTLEVPVPGPAYDHAAWYRGSPTPGRVGPSVILGHVDSAANGPSVFYDLGRLRPGDRITVTSADRSVAHLRRRRRALLPEGRVPAPRGLRRHRGARAAPHHLRRRLRRRRALVPRQHGRLRPARHVSRAAPDRALRGETPVPGRPRAPRRWSNGSCGPVQCATGAPPRAVSSANLDTLPTPPR